jgi:Domain of unknown function (DUF4157)
MRLRLPFGRAQRSPVGAPEPAEVFMSRPRQPQAWRELPVLARSVGEPPLIAPTAPFAAVLAGAAKPPIALAPLTHGSGLEAPAGLAHGVMRVVPGDAVAESHRSTAPVGALRRPRHVREADAEATEPPLAEPGAPVVEISSRRAPVVSDHAIVAGSLVSAADQPLSLALPRGQIGQPQASSASVQRASIVPNSPAPDARPVVFGAEPATAQPQAPGLAAGERLTLGQARRLGLGAPIDRDSLRLARAQPVPNEDAPQPITIAQPTSSGSRIAAQPPVAPATSIATAPDAGSRPHVAPITSAMPIARTPKRTSDAGGSDSLTASSRKASVSDSAPTVQILQAPRSAAGRPNAAPTASSAVRAAPAQHSPRGGGSPSPAARPIIGARPLRTRLQRAPLTASGRAETENGGVAARPPTGSQQIDGPVRVHRGEEASEMAGALEARAFTHGGEVYLPASHGSLSGQKAQSLLAHELTHVAQQRRLGSSLPTEDTGHGRQLEAQAVAAENSRQLPLVLSQPTDAAAASGIPAPQRSAETSPGETATVHVMTTEAPGSGGAAPSTSPQRAPRASDAHFTNPDDQFKAQLDSLEGYLFGRLERRLRRDLLSERERGGTLIDALS